jgi:hypothetical protein
MGELVELPVVFRDSDGWRSQEIRRRRLWQAFGDRLWEVTVELPVVLVDGPAEDPAA